MGEKAFAVLGLFGSARELVDAIPKVRERRLGRLEAYTPYPVHGLGEALGLRRSPLGGMVLALGILGAAATLFFEWWTAAADYRIVTGGKALFSWEAFVPILFEVTVLFATFTAGLGMLFLLNRLPSFRHPVLSSGAISAITRDRFALSIERERGGPDLDAEAARKALLEAGAASVEVLPMPEPLGPLSPRLLLRMALGIVVACVVAGLATYWAVKLFPVLPPMVHMLDQPRLEPYRESAFFRDGSGMRLPVEGTVARGHMPYFYKSQDEAAGLANPLPRTAKVLARGKKIYNDRCAVCHGVLGNGVPALTGAYGAKPADLLGQTVRDSPDGKIYHAIVVGKNSMPSYAADIAEDDRWAAVHYVRALERGQNAKDEDLNP